LLQSSLVWVIASLAFLALSHFMPFTAEFSMIQLCGVAFLWGVIAITRSPSAALGILAQTRAKGPLATFSLAFVMLSDVVVVTLLAIALVIARPLVVGEGGISLSDLSVLGHELLGSVAVGTTLGLILAIYLRLIRRQFLLVLLAIGFSLTEALHYIQVEPLLTFLTAGFVVQNATKQGDSLLHEVDNISGTVFVVFFATAGADLDLPLLRTLWPIALTLCGVRAAATVLSAKIASRVADDVPVVKRFGFAPLISQAGFALGIGAVIARTIPQLGGAFQSMIIACVAINELIGPITLKYAFDKSGESDRGADQTWAELPSNHAA
jgi:Kef-type K+ transport system membrane component KefB